MALGKVRINGEVDGLPGGLMEITPPTIVLNAPVGEVLTPTLQGGDNTIQIPPGATVCAITPDPSNTVALKTKNQAGDSGEPFNRAIPCLKTFDGQTSFIINAAQTLTTLTELKFA